MDSPDSCKKEKQPANTFILAHRDEFWTSALQNCKMLNFLLHHVIISRSSNYELEQGGYYAHFADKENKYISETNKTW